MAYGKRSRQQQVEETVWLPDGTDMARFMLLLSSHHHGGGGAAAADRASTSERLFECKTCNRRFPSFQALGGHRASHKKPRLADGEGAADPPKPKVHGCSICGLQFSIGQALGGHMRRHRAVEADAIVGMGLGLGVGTTKDDVKKTARAELVLDLNEPAMEEEPDRVKLELSAQFPITVDFLR